MAITRRWQAGFESNTTSSTVEFSGINSSPSVQSTVARTGTYSFRFSGSGAYGYVDITATRQMRASFHWYAGAAANSAGAALFEVRDAAANVLFYVAGNTLGSLLLYVGGVLQDTTLNAVRLSQWVHIGIDCKIDAAAGWVYVYRDGNEIASFAGNTGNADITRVVFGTASAAYWGNYQYYDDCYIDDTAGEGAAAVVPDRRFAYITPNGDGNYTDCGLVPGAGESHYQDVDERPHDSDTTYAYADALNESDTYTMTTYTVPPYATIEAVIPHYYAKKTDGGTDTEITPRLRYNATDDDGTSQDLPTGYSVPLWERFTTKPDGGAWTQAAVDGLEVGFVGTGTF